VINLVGGCDRDPRPNHSGQPIINHGHGYVLLMHLLHPCTHSFVHVRIRVL
jgi:hypothetical protein